MEEEECRYLGRGMNDGEDQEFRKEWKSRKICQLLAQIHLGRGMNDGEDKEFRKKWKSRKICQLLAQIPPLRASAFFLSQQAS